MYRANCAFCGDVVIRADEASLHVAGRQRSWQCTFLCPVCGRVTLGPVSAGTGELLVARGAQVTFEPMPAEEAAPCEPPPRPDQLPQADVALQLDDVIDFHALLAEETWFDHLVQSLRSSEKHNA